MLELLLTPLLSLSLQDPAQDPGQTPPEPAVSAPVAAPNPGAAAGSTTAATPNGTRPEQWLPIETMVALTIGASANDAELQTLLASAEAQELKELLWQTLQGALRGQLPPHLAAMAQELAAAGLEGGMALGVLGSDPVRGPELVLVANLGGATDSLTGLLAGLPTDGDGFHRLGDDDDRLLIRAQNGYVALGTTGATVRAALEGTQRRLGTSLADDPDFARSLPTGGERRVAHLFARPRQLVDLAGATLTDEQLSAVRRATSVLGVDSMQWGAVSVGLADGELVTSYQLASPQGFSLLDALAGTTGRIDANLARFVPTSATSFGFYAVDFGNVWDETLALIGSVQPQAGDQLDKVLGSLRQRSGVDLRADLIGGLGDRLLTLTVETNESQQLGLLLELRQPSTFERAFGKLAAMLPVPMTEGTVSGAPCWRVPAGADETAPAVAVVGDWLALATSDAALGRIVRHVQAPKANPEVLTFLRSLPPDAVWASQGPVLGMTGPWLEQFDLGAGGADADRRSVLRRTADRFVAEERVDARAMLRSSARIVAAVSGQLGAGGATGRAPTRTARGGGAGRNPKSGSDPEAVAALQRAETEGVSRQNKIALAALLTHRDTDIVARATWLLGEWKATESASMLAGLAADHPDAGIRLQALGALSRMATKDVAPQLIDATEDDDRRVRTLALQTLSRLGAQVATQPALAVLDQFGSEATTESPSDLVVALVMLHDIGSAANLLPAATSVGFEHNQTGQALTFLFQGLSPRMTPQEEVATLLSVLDHPETMLRRYAIQRLGELRDPSAVPALEGRLAAEGKDLQPLVRVSLAQLRGDVEPPDNLVERAKGNVTAISKMVERRWAALDTTGRIAVAGLGGLLLLGLLMALMMRRRKKRIAAATVAADLVGPSQQYQQQQWRAEDHYDEHGEYDEYEDEHGDEVGAGHGHGDRY